MREMLSEQHLASLMVKLSVLEIQFSIIATVNFYKVKKNGNY